MEPIKPKRKTHENKKLRGDLKGRINYHTEEKTNKRQAISKALCLRFEVGIHVPEQSLSLGERPRYLFHAYDRKRHGNYLFIYFLRRTQGNGDRKCE